MADEKEYKYAVTSDGFNIWLAGDHVHAKDKVLTLNEAQQKDLMHLTAKGKRPDITRELIYIDQEAAEKIAKEHIAKQPAAAHQGGTHSGVGKMGADKPKSAEPVHEITPKEPAGMTLKQRIAASREKVLGDLNVTEENAIHADETAPPVNVDEKTA